MPTKEKILIGALIGFALGLHIASKLLNTFSCANSFTANLIKESHIFVFVVGVVSIFSFFGIHCMSDNSQSKTEEEF
jgi:hypothetical protein